MKDNSHHDSFRCLLYYVLFGTLHEACHFLVAHSLQCINDNINNGISLMDVVRAVMGRYAVLHLDDTQCHDITDIVLHAGWIGSVLLLLLSIIICYKRRNEHGKMMSMSSLLISCPMVYAAFITAVEALVTDLFRWTPHHYHHYNNTFSNSGHAGYGERSSSFFVAYCGNFGILLLNPTWLNIDGGRTALCVLEKMVEVTMMRGAQSGGVVTFEPTSYTSKSVLSKNSESNNDNSLRGVRSRTVNAKRTDLSHRIIHQLKRDNCTWNGNLRGWDKDEYNNNDDDNRLVRGFFGHTRFATSSVASLDGTHPHQWCERRIFRVYHFDTSNSSNSGGGSSDNCYSSNVGVENYITHNGDFEFFKVNNKYYDVEVLQRWLEHVLGVPLPATVDSAAIAGTIDLLRCQGSFALSARYALCLKSEGSKVAAEPDCAMLSIEEYEVIASYFEQELDAMLQQLNGGEGGRGATVSALLEQCSTEEMRSQLTTKVTDLLREQLRNVHSEGASPVMKNLKRHFNYSLSRTTSYDHQSSLNKSTSHERLVSLNRSSSNEVLSSLNISSTDRRIDSSFVSNMEEGNPVSMFVRGTIDAFFDNDLLHSTRLFLENAKGSFGLCVVSSLDARRQVCFAARGQTLSIAFYPKKGLICFGSEQAAVKAGLNYENPGGNINNGGTEEADNAVRLDLDDLGGEICLLDWKSDPAISAPNRNLIVNKVMNVNVILLHQNKLFQEDNLHRRMVLLENNEFIKPLLNHGTDPVLADIRDIPKICSQIQEDWHTVGLNRMTAWNLANCIRNRLNAFIDGKLEPRHSGTVDILVTGCEVSLWVAEQFVSDLQKSFPKLGIRAVSSNKLLGLFGQELAMPCPGFPFSQKSMDLKDPIVIIVSHSGGTFGPLACSNLLQSFSSSIFAVTSEWDTQIGKQLRSMYSDDLLSSRIFSTDCGVRPAEPCSVSVVATHQLLTNIFEHICVTIISNPQFVHVSGSQITERDLQILERCNQDNIKALEEIVGVDRNGDDIHERRTKTPRELRAAGDLWSEHILENAKAYIMSFVYIVFTVTSGFPLVSGIATACGLNTDPEHWAFFITRFFDAFIYFWLPQINIIILRLLQRRNLRHRMVGRTVVIGDCPWVAQSAEAFLSKIFACSYSIAGLNVLSGNPADHLVHRMTHRVVRGSLLICGRPDGRLPALTSLEASTCLSVNQASSIQSIGGTCESITIGHNKSKLPLSHKAIYLKSHRPLFLSEKVLDDIDAHDEGRQRKSSKKPNLRDNASAALRRAASTMMDTVRSVDMLDLSLSRSRKARVPRSSASLLGAYVNLEKEARMKRTQEGNNRLEGNIADVISHSIKERQGIENAKRLFNKIDTDGDGFIQLPEFITAYQKIDPTVTDSHLRQLFEEADLDEVGRLTFDEFLAVSSMPNLLAELVVKNRDERGLVQVQASKERYFGEEMRKHGHHGVGAFAMSASQHFSMELYESRVASMQRFVAMTIMFHQMGTRVQSFFPKISFGLLGYRCDRTHSIMRIATTASPVSGADVREKMDELRIMIQIDRSVRLISRIWKNHRKAVKPKKLSVISENGE